MLSAEDSTIMPEKHHHRWPLFPQRAQTRGLTFRIRKRDTGELAAIGFGHAGHSLGCCWPCQERWVSRRSAQMIADQKNLTTDEHGWDGFNAENEKAERAQVRIVKGP